MLADDVAVHAARIDAEPLADQGAQPGRVEHRARPDHAAGREAGELQRGVGQDVHRVRDDQQDGVRRGRGDLGDHAAEDLGVLSTRSRRVSPGFCAAPAVMTTICASAQSA